MINIYPYIYRVLLLTSSVIMCNLASAEMYKWVDADGNTHYTQSPPMGDVSVETIKPPPSRVDTEAAKKAIEMQKKTLDKIRDDRISAEEEKEKKEEEILAKQQKCKQAKKRLTSYQQRPRVSIENPDGTTRIMSEDERQSEINISKDNIKTFCS